MRDQIPKHTVDILLAAFNGQKYLREQLESILMQTFQDWKIIVRDDYSSDGTLEILQEYQVQHPEKIIIINDQLGNVGILQNFSILMQHSAAPYIMFCDQDDIWLPQKIYVTLECMQRSEQPGNVSYPTLLHTDLTVVDKQLNEINPSFWQYQNIIPQHDSLNRLLVQNTITGCSVMINRKLLKLASPIPKQAIMHDWWIGLIAAAFGRIIIINHATVLYRQHENNDTGAKHWCLSYIFNKMLNFNRDNLLKSIVTTQKQANVLLDRFEHELSNEHKELINSYVSILEESFLKKRFLLYKHKLLNMGVIRNLGLLLRI